MIRNNIIRSLFSLVLIGLFAFGITPKKTLHELFGCHTESNKSVKGNGKAQVADSGYHCSCQQPDLQPPFLQQPLFKEPGLPTIYFPGVIHSYTTALFERAVLFSTLRGPPAFV